MWPGPTQGLRKDGAVAASVSSPVKWVEEDASSPGLRGHDTAQVTGSDKALQSALG